MLDNCFTIWSENYHIKNMAEDLLFNHYKNNFLWPEKLTSHRQWLDNRVTMKGMKHSHILVTAESQLLKLKEVGVRILYLDAHVKISVDTSGYDVIVSGVNSIGACKTAIEFFVNQSMRINISHQTSLFLLPNFSNSYCRDKGRNKAIT
jgi:hypothetical protein